MKIEQAIYGGQDAGGYQFLGRSPGFADGWTAEAQRLCTRFGERPPGVACPLAIFALPLGSAHVAVVQASDRGSDDAGRPGAMCFRLLVLPAKLYAAIGGDPFRVSDLLPPDWAARGELPSLGWTAGPPPRRLVADLRRVLDVEEDRTQTLLGGAQILVDGGRLVFERPAPDERVVRDLWALLPISTRERLWPATFAFGNHHPFHVVVTPRAGDDFAGYTGERQAGDYPESRYELALQHAVESDDQNELDAVLARRSRSQTLWLAVVLLIGFGIAALVINFPMGGNESPQQQKKPVDDKPKLRPAANVPLLRDGERQEVAKRLTGLAKRLGVGPPRDKTDVGVGDALADLDVRLDAKLADKKPSRDPGPLDQLGPARRRLEALAWKHGVADYGNEKLNADELLERLEAKLKKDGVIEEEGRD